MSEQIQSGPAWNMHLDADQLSAFLEDSLPEHEYVLALAHLAECPSCRETVFLSQEASPEMAPAIMRSGPVPEAKPFWSRWFLPMPLAGMAALAAMLLVFAVWRHQPRDRFAAEHEAKVEPGPTLQMEERAQPAAQAAPAQPQAGKLQAEPQVATATAAGPAAMALKAPPPPPKAEAKQSAEIADQAQVAAARVQPPAASAAAGAAVSSDVLQLSQRSNAPAPPPPSAQKAAVAPAPQPVVTVQSLPMEGRSMAGTAPAASGVMNSAPRVAAKQARAVPSVTGSVKDASGAVVPGAIVTLRFADKSNAGAPNAQTRTASDGQFSLAEVPPGKYDLQITSPGFQAFNRQIDLQPNAPLQVQPILSVGAATETVEVSNASSRIQTTPAYAAGLIMADASLPGGLSSVSTATAGGSTLALDSAGNLYEKHGSHKWKQISATWAGKAVQVRTIPGQSEGFQLNTDAGTTWVSVDGERWRQIKHPPAPQVP